MATNEHSPTVVATQKLVQATHAVSVDGGIQAATAHESAKAVVGVPNKITAIAAAAQSAAYRP